MVADAVRETMDPTGNLSTMANSGATKGRIWTYFPVGWHARFDGRSCRTHYPVADPVQLP